MKRSLFIFTLFLFGSIAIAFIKSNTNLPVGRQVQNSKSNIQNNALGCAPADDEYSFVDASDKFIRLMPGWGSYSYAITTSSDSAQIYFNQGLTMHYSYHSREAIASFKEASRLDSTSTMAYWGQALSMGPTYNFGYAYKMNAQIPRVLALMNRMAEVATAKEKDLIAAMNTRYNVQDTADKERKQLNRNYAAALKTLVAKYPDDLDIKALYIDAVMLLHSWDFWYNDGRPKEWTTELVKYCEDILNKSPQHPAALHYYIHVTEASRKPEVALASADSLIKLFPGVAHMVHMSSHEYERIGYYAKGVVANEKADVSLMIYDSLAKGLFPQVHVPHYYHVDAYCALSGGMYKKGLQKSVALRNLVRPSKENHYAQYQFMFPLITMIRMGKWNEILQDNTSINKEWSFAVLLSDFAKGMAHAKTGNIPEAEKHLNALKGKKNDEGLKERFTPYMNSPYECAEVAENILLATIRFQQKKYSDALFAISNAIRAEDSLIYTEPKMWILPARQYQGAFLSQLKEWKYAEKVYREDLVWNPGNGWSLVGLHNALKAQGKNGELKKLKELYMVAFSEADEVPGSSAY
ncbi:MAG: hypothetical protein ACXWV9_02880 [Flavisolibacter sp.]